MSNDPTVNVPVEEEEYLSIDDEYEGPFDRESLDKIRIAVVIMNEAQNAIADGKNIVMGKLMTPYFDALDSYIGDLQQKIEQAAKSNIDSYVENTTKPSLDTYADDQKKAINSYVENTSKPAIDKYAENQKTELSDYTDDKKTELNNATNNHKTALSTHASNLSDDLDTHTDNKKTELNSYTDGKKTELNTYTTQKKGELDDYKDDIITVLDEKAKELEKAIQDATDLGLADLVNEAREIKADIQTMKTQVATMQANVASMQSDTTATKNAIDAKAEEMNTLYGQMLDVASQVSNPTVAIGSKLYTISTKVVRGQIIRTYTEVVASA